MKEKLRCKRNQTLSPPQKKRVPAYLLLVLCPAVKVFLVMVCSGDAGDDDWCLYEGSSHTADYIKIGGCW